MHGATDADTAYGLAWAHAEDHFLTIQQSTLAARGRLATVEGRDAAPIDYLVALLRVREVTAAGYPTLAPDTRALLEGHATGLNADAAAHADEVLSPELFPVAGEDLVAASVQKAPLFFGLDVTLAALSDPAPLDEQSAALARPTSLASPTAAGSNVLVVGSSRTPDGATHLISNSHQPWTGPVAWSFSTGPTCSTSTGWTSIPTAPPATASTASGSTWAWGKSTSRSRSSVGCGGRCSARSPNVAAGGVRCARRRAVRSRATGACVPTPPERRGWSRLLAAVAAELVGTVHDLHRAGSDLAFRFVGPLGRPVKRVHDAVVDRSYRGVQLGCAGAGELGALLAEGSRAAGHHTSAVAHHALDPVADRAGGAVGAAAALADHQLADRLGKVPAEDRELASMWTAPWDVRARSMAHGVLDERFFAIAPELDLELTLRHQGHEVAPDPASLRRTYPRATSRIAVFVHGLVHSEGSWFDGAEPGSSLPAVAAALGVTPVLVRYGTGRAIGRNGADLARLLDQVVAAWPVPVEELTIVGHSMGGLVARAAAVTASREAQRWPAVLARVVYLGSPHLGSWLEKVANVTSWTLRRVSPASAPIGRLLDGRSRGIKDLRFGTLLEEGWGGADLDDLLSGLAVDEPWLAEVDHHLIVGRLRPTERHLLNLVFGDSLVRVASAAGAGRIRRIAGDAQVSLVPLGASHVALSRHPEVASLLRTAWSA